MSGPTLPHHDDGAVSSSSEDHSNVNERRHHRAQAQHLVSRRSGAASTSGTGGAAVFTSDREQHLTELLARASDAIRKEREKVAALELETRQLREHVAQLVSSNATASPTPATTTTSTTLPPQQQLRKKLQDLSLDHFIALEEITRLRSRVRELEIDAALEVVVISPMKSPIQSSRNNANSRHAGADDAVSGVRQRRSHSASDAAALAHVRRATVTVVTSPPPKSAARRQHHDPSASGGGSPERIPPEHHTFDAMRSVKQQHRVAAASSSPNRLGPHGIYNNNAVAPSTPTTAKQKKLIAAHQHHNMAHDLVTAVQAPPPGSVGSGGVGHNYNDVMIHRLRRALAPQPTKEQLGEVVHAMVVEMVRQLKQRGATLDIKKVDHGVYTVNGKKKIHLTIDSGRLVVKLGGGHVDFLEFLERNRLCVKLQQS